jgi:hypothetical protein
MKDAAANLVNKLKTYIDAASPTNGMQIGITTFATSAITILDLSSDYTTIYNTITSNTQGGVGT